MDSLSEALQQLLYDFLAFLPDFATALIIFIASIYLAGLISRVVKSSLERRKTDSAFILLLVKIARYMMIGFGTFTALYQVGFNLTAFLIGLGILDFTLGFALQDVSKNFVSGLLLLMEQPFDKGDVIKVSDQFGTVSKTDLRMTELYTFDGQTVNIPNGDVFTRAITNYSRYPKRRMDITVGVAYGSDLELVRKAAFEAVETVPSLLSDPPPFVIF
jgi:small-conductance mechanosensitive channel